MNGAFEVQDRIIARAVNEMPTVMPPGGSIPANEKAILKAWVDGGAPRSQAETEPTWERNIGDLLTTQCGECHTAPPTNGAPSSFRLDVYDRTEAGGQIDGAQELADRIDARAVTGTTMPPSGPLSAEERGLLRAWIDADTPR